MQTNESSQMSEYHGAVLETVNALTAVIHGGQIAIDINTFKGLTSSLVDLAKAVPDSPNYELLAYRGSSRNNKRSSGL